MSGLNNCHENAVNIVSLAEKLNNSFQMKIYEYSNKKEFIKKLRETLVRQLEIEEDLLLRKLDTEIENEQKYS